MKSLSPGMCNLAINMHEEERRLVGKLAFNRDMSCGAFIRSLYLRALETEAPEDAKQVREIRRKAKGITLLAAALYLAWLSMAPSHQDNLYARVRAGRRRQETELAVSDA
jgi:hypothetical protein